MNRHRLRRPASAVTASLLLFVTAAQLLSVTTASAYPGDVFVTGNPVKPPDSGPEPTSQATAGHSVDDSGAVEYAIPLPVAPNRQNMVPDLALRYSSRSPARGGVAAGWTLGVPVIERDTSRGVLRHADYRSSLSKGSLIRVGDPDELIHSGLEYSEEYRAEEDGNHVKYVRYFTTQGTTKWRAYTTDGRVYDFGATPESRDVPGSAAAPGATESRYFVTRVVDRFGNEIQFNYQRIYANVAEGQLPGQPVDVALASVEYGKNTNAGLSHHSRLSFEYAELLDQCPDTNVPIGASFDFRSGIPLYKGAARLTNVRLEVANGGAWTERRKLTLAYDMTELGCNLQGKAHSPLRLLKAVTESATAPDGAVTTMPPVTFNYQKLERTFDERLQGDTTPILGSGQTPRSYGKAGGWPTIQDMLLDLDGDGRLDALRARTAPDYPTDTPPSPPLNPWFCEATWAQRTAQGYASATLFGATLPNPQSGAATPNVLPVMPWANGTFNGGIAGLEFREGCSLAAQFSHESTNVPANETCGAAASYLSYRFIDMDGDGLPDLVTSIDTNRGQYRPEDDARVQPKGQFCFEPGACRDQNGDPALCKVVSSLPGPLFLTDDPTHQGSCPDGQGCWKAGCGGDWEACCSDISTCSETPNFGNNWAPPSDTPPPGWDWPGSPDDDLPRSYNGVGTFSGQVGGEDRPPIATGNTKCMQWPEIYCGRYVLRVYKNLGGGQLSGTPQLVLAPVPLETDRPTSQLGPGDFAAASSWHTFGDLDGDDIPDAVHMEPFFLGVGSDYPSSPDHFSVFPGTGDGAFASAPQGGGYTWSSPRPLMAVYPSGPARLRARAHLRESDATQAVHSSYEEAGMHDMNGDGLADYVDRRSWFGEADINALRVFHNTGRGFQSDSTWPGYKGTVYGPKWQNKVSKLERSMDWSALRYSDGNNRRGYSRTTHRLVDVDADGLMDLVVLPDVTADMKNPWTGGAGQALKIYLNVGDRLVYAGTNATWEKIRPALGRITTNEYGKWFIVTDLVDIDGDGLTEAITSDEDPALCDFNVQGVLTGPCVSGTGWTDSAASGPMRALTSVSNGKGGVVSFTYAPSRPTSGRVPYPVWVASSVTVNAGTDALGAQTPASVVTYAYDLPAYNQDFQGRWGFRGFGKSTVTGPSGSKVITTRTFSPYYGGRTIDVRTVEAGGHVASIEQTTWEQRSVFDTDVHPGTVKTQHVVARDVRTCGAAQTEAQCATQGALRHDAYTLFPLVTATDSTPRGYYSYQVVSGPAAGPIAGAVYSAYWDQLHIAPGKYWITRLSEWSGRYSSYGVYETATQTSHYYDTSKTVELWTSRYIGAAEGWATASHVYDMATGNLVIERSPKHFGMQVGTVFGYDAQKRFVTQITNELGHVTTKVVDPATGVALEERGPNTKNGVLDGVIRTIDGLGRVKTESRMIDDPTLGYVPVQVLDVTYQDTAAPHVKVTTKRRIELGESRWTRDEEELDGLGRPIGTSTYDGATLVARTSIFRDASGNVVRARVPRPDAVLSTDTVDWTFGYDSLGRAVAIGEPARSGCTEVGSSPAAWCGQKVGYDGRTTLHEDVAGTLTGAQRGTLGKTRVTTNALGQTALVEELTSSGAWAQTTYGYEGHGQVASILNADGVSTSTVHDQLGRRRSVTRGGKTWSYDYDLNGNMTKIQAPVPAGETAAKYAVTFTFDDLNREVTRTAGSGNIAPGDIAALGAGSTQRTYDLGTNGKGRLSHVGWSHGATDFQYDSRGNVTSTSDSFSILGGAYSDTRTRQVTYNALGQPHSRTTGEGSSFGYTYDNRGLATAMSWSGDSSYPVVQLSRSAAGRLLQRTRPTASGTRIQSNVGHDLSGRISNVMVSSRLPGMNGLTTRSWETFLFDGTGEVYQMSTTLAAGASGSWHTANFAYDAQHQLVTATGPHAYSGAFTYSPGGRVLSAQVAADASAARVHGRSVTYTYGANVIGSTADPDAPVALTSAGGSAWMTMDYDLAGNVLTRDIGAESFDHIYDGGNRQRAVTAPDGTHDVYWYDGTGMRSLVATADAGGTIQQVRWNLGDVEIWYAPDGTVDSRFANVAVEGQGVRIVDGTTVEHQFNDPRGHLIAAVADDGSLRGGFRYGPYGELLDEIGTTPDESLRRFNGKEYDETSGLTYYGRRYFDERTLAWTQGDPLYRFAPDKGLYEPRRTNLYSFTLGNPVRFTDPDGLDIKISWLSKTLLPYSELSGEGGIAPIFPGQSKVHAEATVTVGVGDGHGGLSDVDVTIHSILFQKPDGEAWVENQASTHNPRLGAVEVTEGSLFGGDLKLTVNGATILDLKGSEYGISFGASKEGPSGTIGYTYTNNPAQLPTGSGNLQRRFKPLQVWSVTPDEWGCFKDPTSCTNAPDQPSAPEPETFDEEGGVSELPSVSHPDDQDRCGSCTSD